MKKRKFFLLKWNFFVVSIRVGSTMSKIEIMPKNQKNFPKIEILVKVQILAENITLRQKSKFWPKIRILVENRNFGQKSEF